MRLLPISLLLCLVSCAYGQATELLSSAETLKGIKTFAVRIERVHDTFREIGVDESVIRTAVELRLRSLGLPISRSVNTLPFLYINATTVCSAEISVCAVTYILEFTQPVLLLLPSKNTDSVVSGITYTDGITLLYGTRALRDAWRVPLLEIVDKFANEFLAQKARADRDGLK